jgi:3-hydroxyisobutyrate dehydrogenase
MRDMNKIGIIGIGMLGNAVALHLLDVGFQVTIFNRTKEKAIQLKEKGAIIATSPKEVATKSELIIIIVKDANAVKEISFENNGIIEGVHDGLIVADMSTIDPLESKQISERFLKNNINKLDIPVMGGPNVAISGKLMMMASGDKKSFEQCRNIFEKIANKIFFLGENGTAHSIKLAMNLQITMLALALSEGIMLVEKTNIDPKKFLEILNSTYFKTGMSENKAFKMIDGKYDATFTLKNLKKDIDTILSSANSLELELPMLEKAKQVYDDAVNQGFGEIDYTGIIAYMRKINKK